MKAKISNQKGVMMKQLLLLILMVLSLAGCKQIKPWFDLQKTSEKPEMKYVYDLPDFWKRVEDTESHAFFTKAKEGPVGFAVSGVSNPDGSLTAQKERDQRYAESYCAPTVEDGLRNCAKGFQKKQLKVDDIDVFLFQRYGELFNLDLLATEVYWEKDGNIHSMLITGNFEEAIPALTSVVRTLHYETKE